MTTTLQNAQVWDIWLFEEVSRLNAMRLNLENSREII